MIEVKLEAHCESTEYYIELIWVLALFIKAPSSFA